VGVHPTDFIMMTFLDFFPDCVYDARIEDCFTPERIAERAEMRAQARADAEMRVQARSLLAAQLSPEQIAQKTAERVERRAAYKREGEERRRIGETAWQEKEAVARQQRLMLGLALHPRLGENSPLASLAEFVLILAKQI